MLRSLLVALVLGFTAVGCSPANRVKNGTFVNAGGQVVCPVQGTVISDGKGIDQTVVYHGVTYHFCCAGCPEEFKAHPSKYAIQ